MPAASAACADRLSDRAGGWARDVLGGIIIAMPVVESLCRVHGLLPDNGSVGTTGIDKRPVGGPVKIGEYGLYADVQADRKHHGGLTKAVYAYATEDAEHWAALLGRDIAHGLFGENLRTRGLDVSGAVIGERWMVGAGVVLEVTCPRTPCATFGRRMGERGWVRRFAAEGRPGAYLRVVTTGVVEAGDEVRVIDRPDHGVTIASWFTQRRSGDAAALLAAHESGRHPLVPEMIDSLAVAIASNR
jgi:MOSC domain-containing protein YiiM